MSSIKTPPVFNPDEDDDYLKWKADVEIWKLFTDTAKEKIGAAVYLSLKGKARDVIRGIDATIIGSEQGFVKIIEELDRVYQKDDATRAFCAFRDFYEYRRSGGQHFSEFIVEYEQLYKKLKGVLSPEGC